MVKNKFLVIGKNGSIDRDAKLGYRTGRKIGSRRLKIGSNATVRKGTVIYEGTEIGDGLETGHNAVIREENSIGDNFKIWNNSTVDYGCKIGNNVRVHCNVYVSQFTTNEDDVFLAPGVITANDPHPICTRCMKGPAVRKGAKIGAGAILLPGVVIGRYSLVGAGSVVTGDVPPYSVAYGNPARAVKSIFNLKCRAKKRRRPYEEVKRRK